MSGQRAGLGRDTFLQVAVTGDNINFVIDYWKTIPVEVIGQIFLCDCHPYGVGNSLAERAGRHFNTEIRLVFGMTRRFAGPLPEHF